MFDLRMDRPRWPFEGSEWQKLSFDSFLPIYRGSDTTNPIDGIYRLLMMFLNLFHVIIIRSVLLQLLYDLESQINVIYGI